MDLKKFYRFLSLKIWGGLPSAIQRKSSAIYTNLYNTSFSRHFINPYIKVHYEDPDYLKRFVPASGNDTYTSFQDFFTRKLKESPEPDQKHARSWPCEGLLCEYDKVENLQEVVVKKQRRNLRAVFGKGGESIPDTYYYSNVFLHNKDYHRIHAPVNGQITRIEHIPGDLVLLRPWIYPEDPSHPALRNERYNIDLTDDAGKTWYLSIVGGPAVGTIELSENTLLDAQVKVGEEVATFLLGSTCCMASPVPVQKEIGDSVIIGEPL